MSFTCCYFTCLLEVYFGPCIHAFVYPRSTRPWMVYIFLVVLLVSISLGSVGEAASFLIVFTPALWRCFHLTIVFVYFNLVSFQHIGLLEKTWGLCSVLKGYYFRSYFSDIFLEEAPKLSAKYISCQFMCELLRFFLTLDLLGSFLSCCWVVSYVWNGNYLEGSTPLLRVPLMIKSLQHFSDKFTFWLQVAYLEFN